MQNETRGKGIIIGIMLLFLGACAISAFAGYHDHLKKSNELPQDIGLTSAHTLSIVSHLITQDNDSEMNTQNDVDTPTSADTTISEGSTGTHEPFIDEYTYDAETLQKKLKEESEEGCAGMVATGSCAKDGRSIFWKTRHIENTTVNKPYYFARSASRIYKFLSIGPEQYDVKMGLNEVGLAVGSFTANSPDISTANRQFISDATMYGDRIRREVLGNNATVREAAYYIARHVNVPDGEGSNHGIVSSEYGVGAVVSANNLSGTVYTNIAWVNNTWVPIDNALFCEDAWDDDNNGRTINSTWHNITEPGSTNSSDGDNKVTWEDICHLGAKNVRKKELGSGSFSTEGEISRNLTVAAFVAVSGNNSYNGSLNIAWVQLGRQTLVGVFLPLGASYLNSDTDIPTEWTFGAGMEGYTEPKVNYATHGGGLESNTYFCTETREILHYANSVENHSFDAYQDLTNTIMTATTDAEAQDRLEAYADHHMLLNLIQYKNNLTYGEKGVHNLNKKTSYSTIQAAINDADDGNLIYVLPGTYYENILINKRLTIQGENKDTTIIDGSSTTDDTIDINANYVVLQNFTIRNSNGAGKAGVYIHADLVELRDCIITNNPLGVLITSPGDSNTITHCTISKNTEQGIYIISSLNNNITKCTVTENQQDGIYITDCNQNKLFDNTIENNHDNGIELTYAKWSEITYNDITSNNKAGINLSTTDDGNHIYHNTITDNLHDGIYSENSIRNDFNYNIINHNDNNGIKTVNSELEDIMNNTISQNDDAGIYLSNSFNCDIEKNTITKQDTGVYLAASAHHITITHNLIDDNDDGIHLQTASDNTISYTNVTNNNIEGIRLDNSIRNIIYLNNITDNIYYGISLADSSDNTIHNNTITHHTTGHGIYLGNADENRIRDNTMTNNAYSGVTLSYSAWNTLARNTINISNFGISLSHSDNNTMVSNDCNDTNYGITIGDSSHDNTISTNTVTNSTYDGISIGGGSKHNNINNTNVVQWNKNGILIGYSSYNTVTENTVLNNQVCGISIDDSTYTTVISNTVNFNDVVGINVEGGSYNTVDDNNADANKDYGIYLLSTSYNTIANNSANTTTNLDGIHLISNSNYNTVSHNYVDNNWHGIALDSSSHNTITFNKATNNDIDGIHVESNSDENTLTSNIVSGNWRGIVIEESSKNNLTANTIQNNQGVGIFLESSTYNTLDDNTVDNNDEVGIKLQASSHNTLTDNTVQSHDIGIRLTTTSNDNSLDHNIVLYNNEHGIYIHSSSYNNINYTTTYTNSLSGIQLLSTTYTTLYKNTVNNTPVAGINITYGNNNALIENTAFDNERGIMLDQTHDNTLIDNTVNDNINYGIYLLQSTSNNLTGNHAETSSTYIGILLKTSTDNDLIANSVSNNSLHGIALETNSNDNTIINNTAEKTSEGIYLVTSSYNELRENQLSKNKRSIRLENNADYNKIIDNRLNDSDYGIYIYQCTGTNITGNNVTFNDKGIYLLSSTANLPITENQVYNNTYGIYLYKSSSNSLTSNTVHNNTEYGIFLTSDSDTNSIIGNTVKHNGKYGIYISYSTNNNINTNTVQENHYYDIYIDGNQIVHSLNTITGNIGSGNPGSNLIYYYNPTNSHQTYQNFQASELIMFYTDNVTILDVVVSGSNTLNNNGIILYNTNDSQIKRTTSTGNYHGITFSLSHRNTVYNCSITHNGNDGIKLAGSMRNIIQFNTIANNTNGIVLFEQSNNNEITRNNISNNSINGVYSNDNSGNIFYYNNFRTNSPNACDYGQNIWDNGYPKGGNYWDDWDETSETAYDDYKGQNQDQSGSDGIVDKGTAAGGGRNPYVLPGRIALPRNQDRYPRLNPWKPSSGMQVNPGFNPNTPGFGTYQFGNLQDALTHQVNGGSIYVDGGVYQENVVIDKTIALYGEHTDTTTITGGPTGNVITITAPDVTITGFTIQNSGTTLNDAGILLLSNANTIMGNRLEANRQALRLQGSSQNTIMENNFFSNWYGMYVTTGSGGSTIYHNNFMNSFEHHAFDTEMNSWDNGINEGNYWDDYQGPGPYPIPGGPNEDHYPVMNPSGWNHPPYQPFNFSPSNNSWNISIESDLQWIGDDPDPGDTVTYDVYFGTTNPPPQVATHHLDLTYDPSLLDSEVTYYWQIVACDSNGGSTAGPILMFSSAYIPPEAHTVALWYFDENTSSIVYDETSYSNDGTITGADWTTGKFGPGLYFGGGGLNTNGDGITVAHSTNLDITSHFSVEAWIKATGPDTQSNFRGIVDKYRYHSGIEDGFTFYLDAGRIRLSIYSGTAGTSGVIGTTNLRDNTWHHVRGTWDGSTISVYVDSVMENEVAWTHPPASTTNNLGIGKRLSGWGGYMPFYGKIDHVRLTCNRPPSLPSSPTPPDHASAVRNDAELSWTGSDPEGDTVTYDVYFGTTYPLPLVSANQTDVTYDPGTLDDNTSYSWQIIAWTDTLSTNGPVWTFTTEAISNNAPYTPADPSPIDGDTSISLDTELGWTGGDYDHEDTVTYTIYLGNTTPPPLYDTIGPYSAQETLLVYELSQLKYATKYYWRIEARDNHGKNTTGPIWEFTTQIYEVMCGDVTNNGVIDVGDVVYLINYLYRGGPEPQPLLCGGDCNHDDIVNVGDVVYLINYLFRGGPIPSGCCP